ncbi:hypothetical protein [Falsiroseomonas ponticola]|uniref:hypothetical protein n=1 Tax=Falsiroseomonas ponticola TaxID=2786951 RepID=UPI0019314E21|nr:hypothetical protein [Roseomonas ponticola]
MTPLEATLPRRSYCALQILKPILAAAGVPEPDMRQIYVGQRSIREFSTYDGLSRAILDFDMPETRATTILDHYTTGTGFKGIMSSGQLWLSPITLRLNQGELDTFALEHGLQGYVDAKGSHKPALAQAAADLFYLSFTQPQPSEHLWDVFGERGNGYRLRFAVTPGSAGQLRAIRYHGQTTLLRKVNDALASAGLPRFILKQISRVGAFYLPLMLQPENETRLLAKRFPGGNAPTISVGSHDVWPITIGSADKTAELTLIEVGIRRQDRAVVQANLPAWCPTIPVITD